MESFLLRTFTKLKKDAPKRLKELKQACEDQCKELERVESTNDTRENTSISNNENADKYFTPLQLACESRTPKLMEVGLDAIHYLIEHGYLRGRTLSKRLRLAHQKKIQKTQPSIVPSSTYSLRL